MTSDQERVLAALSRFIDAHGYSPSITELMAEVGTSSRNGLQNALNALRDENLITWTKGMNRTLRLVRGTGRPMETPTSR